MQSTCLAIPCDTARRRGQPPAGIGNRQTSMPGSGDAMVGRTSIGNVRGWLNLKQERLACARGF